MKKRADPESSRRHAPAVKVEPSPAARVLARILKKEKVSRADIAHLLAAIKVAATQGTVPVLYQSTVNAPVPVEVLELLGTILIGRGKWLAAKNAERADKARKRQLQLRDAAKKYPNLSSDRAIARRIRADPAMRSLITDYTARGEPRTLTIDTIRKLIAKPKK
jgi:hypothetical protein